MLTSTFQSRKSQRSAQHRSRSACDALSNLTRHSQSLGLNPFNVAGDGHCFFRTLSITLIDLLGSKAAKILVQADCSHAAVRDFLCSWAEQHHDVIIDDEGEETLAQRAADAALAWDRPIAAIDDDGRAIPVEPRFADVLARMRDSEWADEFWVIRFKHAYHALSRCASRLQPQLEPCPWSHADIRGALVAGHQRRTRCGAVR